MSDGILFGNGNVGMETRIRHDNSAVVAQVHSINSDTKEPMANSFLAIDREESETSLVTLIAYNGGIKPPR